MVPRRGLEPPRLSALVPETSASTNSATWACRDRYGSGFRLVNSPSLAPVQRRTVIVFGARLPAIDEPGMTAIATDTLVTVFGGSGFLGRHVVRALAKRGYRVRVAVRRPELAGHLQPLGQVGQIHAVQANLRYPDSVEAAARGAHVVINLVGILFERGRQRFETVQAFGAEAVALAAAAFGARLVHISAIGADENAP